MGGNASTLVLKYKSLLNLMLFASMPNVSLGVLSVAPDDFSSECIQYADPNSINYPNEKVLLDTQFYQSTSLLTALGEDGLWISRGLDANSSVSSITTVIEAYIVLKLVSRNEGSEVCCLCISFVYYPVAYLAPFYMQWIDNSQSLQCSHNLRVCGCTAETQNDSWMITQYINISITGITQLILNATLRADSCSSYKFLRVRIFPTNKPDELGRRNASYYSGNVAFLEQYMNQGGTSNLDLTSIPISPSTTGLYLAILDTPPGTCLSIYRLALYYYVCPEQVVNLVKYPKTISPTLTSFHDVFVEASCVSNAVLISHNSLLDCNSMGRWDANGVACHCMAGYYFSNSRSCEGKY